MYHNKGQFATDIRDINVLKLGHMGSNFVAYIHLTIRYWELCLEQSVSCCRQMMHHHFYLPWLLNDKRLICLPRLDLRTENIYSVYYAYNKYNILYIYFDFQSKKC